MPDAFSMLYDVYKNNQLHKVFIIGPSMSTLLVELLTVTKLMRDKQKYIVYLEQCCHYYVKTATTKVFE